MPNGTSSADETTNRSIPEIVTSLLDASARTKKAATLIAVAAIVAAPFVVNEYYVRVGFLMLMWVGLAMSWNIIGGLIGYPSFGHVTFLGIGGFTVGLLGQYYGLGDTFGIELIVLLFLAGLAAAGLAAVVAYPLLRLRGGYFAIATLGIAVVVRETFTNIEALGGGIGIAAPAFDPPVLDALTVQYYLMAAIAIFTVYTTYVVKQSKMGYAFAAIREGEDAAKMLGVSTVRYKISGFVLSAFFPGMIGGLYVYFLAYFTAGSLFELQHTVDMIVFTVIGGLGTISGPIIGAPLMVFLSRIVLGDVLRAHVFLTGLFIVVVMLFFPQGIVGVVRDLKERIMNDDGGDAR